MRESTLTVKNAMPHLMTAPQSPIDSERMSRGSLGINASSVEPMLRASNAVRTTDHSLISSIEDEVLNMIP